MGEENADYSRYENENEIKHIVMGKGEKGLISDPGSEFVLEEKEEALVGRIQLYSVGTHNSTRVDG